MFSRLLLVLLCFTFTSTLAEESVNESPVVLRPGAVLIEVPGWPTGEEQTRQIFVASAAAAAYDNAVYNDNFRRPTNGATRHAVNCERAESLALTFIAGWRKGERSVSSMKLRVDWQHDSIEGRRGRDKVFLKTRDAFAVYDAEQERYRSIFVAALGLIDRNEARKVDGTWTLTISFRGDELHREVFELRGCDAE